MVVVEYVAYHFRFDGFSRLVHIHSRVDLELLVNHCCGHILVQKSLLCLCFLVASGPDNEEGHLLSDRDGDLLDEQVNCDFFLLCFDHF